MSRWAFFTSQERVCCCALPCPFPVLLSAGAALLVSIRVFASIISLWAGVFFFSSRRRHTRYIGDWSSDVCSSDLPYLVVHLGIVAPQRERREAERPESHADDHPRRQPDSVYLRHHRIHDGRVEPPQEIGRASCRERAEIRERAGGRGRRTGKSREK